MGFSERLKFFIGSIDVKKKDIPGLLGVSKSMLYGYLRGDNDPSSSFLISLKLSFPELNINWLLTGKGEMIVLEKGISQSAIGHGNIQIGNGGSVSVGNNLSVEVNESEGHWIGGKLVRISQVTKILEDYVAPKIIKEIEERLKKES